MALGVLLVASLHTFDAKAQQAKSTLDSVEVSLLTCSPHEEIYSLYGHSALRWHDLKTGEDLVFNWGVFNFNTPHFVLRFVFGLTDYELGVGDFDGFCNYYAHWGSSVTEQVLNLTSREKTNLMVALSQNLRPENKVYRYNFFYDNCSTRPRDIVERCVSGRVEYHEREDFKPSYRTMVRDHVAAHPWARLGNDLLLGVKADFRTSRTEQEFLPENLMYDFDHAQIYSEGVYRPLVKARRMAVRPGVQMVEEDFPLTPMQCAVALLVVSILIFVAEWKRKKTFKYWDAVLALCVGVAGLVIVVMFFSEHPTTSTNLQVLLFNPLPLFFLPAILRRRLTRRYWLLSTVLVGLFLLGGLFQHYADGMYVLAQCLLIRIWSNVKNG